jgi:hypothetical protein
MRCEIIFGWNFSNNKRILIWENKINRIMVGAKPRSLCRSLLKTTRNFSSPLWKNIYINELYHKNKVFQTNSTVHIVNTRKKKQLHSPIALSYFQKGDQWADIKCTTCLKTISEETETFTVALKTTKYIFLLMNFYRLKRTQMFQGLLHIQNGSGFRAIFYYFHVNLYHMWNLIF